MGIAVTVLLLAELNDASGLDINRMGLHNDKHTVHRKASNDSICFMMIATKFVGTHSEQIERVNSNW